MSNFLSSSIGKKTVMALTGLFLCVFLVEHLYGNLLLYANDGGAAFIEYSHTLVHSILIRSIEVVLFIAIIVHVVQAVYLTKQNSDARPVKYSVNKVNETSTWFSRNMGITGSFILFFIVVHLYHYFVPYRIMDTVGGPGQINVAQAVKIGLQDPVYAGFYFFSVCLLAFHLNHGFQGAFQTLGLSNKRYAPFLKMAGTGFAVLMFVGFASFPVLFYFGLAGGTF